MNCANQVMPSCMHGVCGHSASPGHLCLMAWPGTAVGNLLPSGQLASCSVLFYTHYSFSLRNSVLCLKMLLYSPSG